MLLFGEKENLVSTFTERVKDSGFCWDWPTMCWFFLKAYGAFEYLILERSATFWKISSTVMTAVLVIYWLLRLNRLSHEQKARKRLYNEHIQLLMAAGINDNIDNDSPDSAEE